MTIRRTILFSGLLGLTTGYVFGRTNLRKTIANADSPLQAVKAVAAQVAEDAVELVSDIGSHLKFDIPMLRKNVRSRIARRRHTASAPVRKQVTHHRPQRRPLTPVAARRLHRAVERVREVTPTRTTEPVQTA